LKIWIATRLTDGSSEEEAGCHDPGVAGSAGHHGQGQSKVTLYPENSLNFLIQDVF
jgi:hypothetical protein